MAVYPSKNPYVSQDRYLIAEQPGAAIFISGLLIALFLGLTFRAFIAPARVREQIERAAQNIHKDVNVRFDEAVVSLSDGILPRFSVVISNIRMNASDPCWMTPELSIDQMRLPISIWGLLAGRGAIREIETDQVQLVLRSEYKDCLKTSSFGPEAQQTRETASLNLPTQVVHLESASGNADKFANQIREIRIGKLRIESEKYGPYRAEFHDLDLQMKDFEPRWIVLNAKTHLFRDEQVGDYLAHANIHIEYRDSPEANVQAHFFGNWREGHYSLIGNYSLTEKNLVLESEVKHIPLSQILNLLQKYHLVAANLNARQLWLSFNSRFSGPVERLTQAPFEISDLNLEGDQMEVNSERIKVQSLMPLAYEPIRFNVSHLNLDKVLNFFNQTLSTQIFSHLGSFSGAAEIRSGEDIHLAGTYSGLEFIFSNKGQRELQVVDRMEAQATFAKEKWNIDLSHLELDHGAFDGNIKVQADKTFGDMDVLLKIEGARLSPAVQKLMTQGGLVGTLKTQLEMKTRGGHLTSMKGDMHIPQMKVEGVDFVNTKGRFDFIKDELVLNVQVSSISVEPDSVAIQTLGPLKKVLGASGKDDFLINSLNGQFRTREFRTFHWKNFSGQVGGHGQLRADGGWNEAGELTGSVSYHDKKNQQRWRLGGVREAPEFEALSGRDGL